MVADLSIAWLFWFLIRWPVVQDPLQTMAHKLRASLGRFVRSLHQAYQLARLESEQACRRELRAAGLVD
jgi:hypothetical protein